MNRLIHRHHDALAAGRGLVTSLVRGLVVALAAAAPLGAQRPTYGPTLFFESGIINVPSAWVPPLGGDLTVSYTRLSMDSSVIGANNGNAHFNAAFSAALWGRAEAGVAVYTGDLRAGAFAKLLLIDQVDGIWRRGLRHWLPSVAIGVRNVGAENGLDRVGLTAQGLGVRTAPSAYAVATRTFVLSRGTIQSRPAAQVSLTAGHGNGLFSDDAGAGKLYAKSATGGTFGGVQLDLAAGRFSTLSLMAEHDAWSTNAGVRADLRGVQFTLAVTELGAGKAVPGSIVSQKVALSVSWQANIRGLVRGNRLEQATEAAERAQQDLDRQVRLAQQRIDVIEGQIDALRAIASQEQSAERVELERMLQEERDALKRLQDLIKAREAARRPPP